MHHHLLHPILQHCPLLLLRLVIHLCLLLEAATSSTIDSRLWASLESGRSNTTVPERSLPVPNVRSTKLYRSASIIITATHRIPAWAVGCLRALTPSRGVIKRCTRRACKMEGIQTTTTSCSGGTTVALQTQSVRTYTVEEEHVPNAMDSVEQVLEPFLETQVHTTTMLRMNRTSPPRSHGRTPHWVRMVQTCTPMEETGVLSSPLPPLLRSVHLTCQIL